MLIQTIFYFQLFTFALMKRKYSIGSFLFGLIVFLAILLQSVHSFHHLDEAFATKECHHNYSESTSQITHSHHFDHCFACEFTFSSAVDTFHKATNSKINFVNSKVFFFVASNDISFFKGSSFLLRGPPIL